MLNMKSLKLSPRGLDSSNWPEAFPSLELEEPQPFHSQRHMVYRGVGRQHSLSVAPQCQPHQARSGEHKRCLALARNAHNAPLAAQGCGYIHIADDIDRQSLRTPKAPVEDSCRPIPVNGVDIVAA